MTRVFFQGRFCGSAAAVAAVALLSWGCGQGVPEPATQIEEGATLAEELAQEMIIVDTHIDVPYRVVEKQEDISQRTEGGDFDYVRARAGGLDAPFMSIYVPASFQETGGAKQKADELIDLVEGFERQWPEKFAIAHSPTQVRQQFQQGLISLPLGMENGAPVEEDLENLAHFHDRGVSYITLTHGKNNQISDSSYDPERPWGGLSPFGREVVAEMNRLGIMIDISHVTDEAFFEVLELSQAPVIASHSSCRRFTADWERNMSDDMIRALAANGGVIHINFGSAFLTEEAYQASQEMWDVVNGFAEEHGLLEDDDEVRDFREEYREEHPTVLADVADVADHIDHVVGLVGSDHVGIGSDFDGVGPSTPTGLKDVSYYPNLIRVLMERGYSKEDLRKIFGENTLRVWEEVEAVAAELGLR